MGKGQQVIKFYTHKANALSLNQITRTQQNPLPILPKDYSLHILFGSTIGSIGVGLMALEGKKSDNRLEEARILSHERIELAKINQIHETQMELQKRQHEHERNLAQPASKTVGSCVHDQVSNINSSVKHNVIQQGISRLVERIFEKGGPPPKGPTSATSPYDYQSFQGRLGWFVLVSIITYREFIWMYFIFTFKGKK